MRELRVQLVQSRAGVLRAGAAQVIPAVIGAELIALLRLGIRHAAQGQPARYRRRGLYRLAPLPAHAATVSAKHAASSAQARMGCQCPVDRMEGSSMLSALSG